MPSKVSSDRATATPRCLTCKERKIKCDGARPVCRNCQKARRGCRAANSFELSWPKPRSRRALEPPKGQQNWTLPPHKLVRAARQQDQGSVSGYHFVNVLSDHVAAHFLLPYVTSSLGTKSILFERCTARQSFSSMLSRQAPSLYADVERLQSGAAGESGLVSYFYHEASSSLPQLDSEPAQFRNLLLRMSVQDSSPSSKAVLYSLFCLSALQRYGNVQESSHFKVLALRSLSEAANTERMSTGHILQHMAASLLLCRAEVALGEESTIFWALYICSLRTVYTHAFSDVFNDSRKLGGDARILYRYMHYHDILAQFSVSHWQRASEMERQLSMRFKETVVVFKCQDHLDRFTSEGEGDYLQHEIYLLARAVKASKQEQMDPHYPTTRDHLQNLDSIENQLDTALQQSRSDCVDISTVNDKDGKACVVASLKLQRYWFVAASWIYFQRTCRHLTGPSERVTSLFDHLFSLTRDIRRVHARIAPFSVFLVSAEAGTEQRRRQVMDFIHQRSEKHPSVSEITNSPRPSCYPTAAQIDYLLSASWTQDDLHDNSEGHLDYVTKMQYVITARSILPALV
ncbi:zinc-finger transcription factor [Ophiostoma piceae UAMH 11346]|uniref:Zinc-finger transcription factor n=1 Tax=Ophiostoma piceae (strain UAMH 11346) TaxID=1262450 RepID=S3CDU4_OPHP1|nr:zinc-finger transcription factor [Ophiostoma piceae UAMH 11346]